MVWLLPGVWNPQLRGPKRQRLLSQLIRHLTWDDPKAGSPRPGALARGFSVRLEFSPSMAASGRVIFLPRIPLSAGWSTFPLCSWLLWPTECGGRDPVRRPSCISRLPHYPLTDHTYRDQTSWPRLDGQSRWRSNQMYDNQVVVVWSHHSLVEANGYAYVWVGTLWCQWLFQSLSIMQAGTRCTVLAILLLVFIFLFKKKFFF